MRHQQGLGVSWFLVRGGVGSLHRSYWSAGGQRHMPTTHLGLGKLEAVRRRHDDCAILGADDALLSQLDQRCQRDACGRAGLPHMRRARLGGTAAGTGGGHCAQPWLRPPVWGQLNMPVLSPRAAASISSSSLASSTMPSTSRSASTALQASHAPA